jgi:hypothetical protein
MGTHRFLQLQLLQSVHCLGLLCPDLLPRPFRSCHGQSARRGRIIAMCQLHHSSSPNLRVSQNRSMSTDKHLSCQLIPVSGLAGLQVSYIKTICRRRRRWADVVDCALSYEFNICFSWPRAPGLRAKRGGGDGCAGPAEPPHTARERHRPVVQAPVQRPVAVRVRHARGVCARAAALGRLCPLHPAARAAPALPAHRREPRGLLLPQLLP